jgi:hypothetical protein
MRGEKTEYRDAIVTLDLLYVFVVVRFDCTTLGEQQPCRNHTKASDTGLTKNPSARMKHRSHFRFSFRIATLEHAYTLGLCQGLVQGAGK